MPEPAQTHVGTEDLEAGLPATPPRRFPIILGIALLALLVFNSQGLVGWAQRLPSSTKNEWIATRAADWHDAMQAVGLARPMEWVRAWIQPGGGR